ncbi:hypothetical protein [Streptomyces sp. NPDC087300]|uniref:hypothetical protein n=1 Tax=Streptomyces sp. NPDC087300 TaxID=3365780 RepID=UPI00380CEA88
MTRPTLLRRAAAATIGVDRRPPGDRTLPLGQGRTLTRRVACALIGVRVPGLPVGARAGAGASVRGKVAERADTGRIDASSPSGMPPPVALGPLERPPAGARPRRALVLATVAAVMAIAFGAYAYLHEDSVVTVEPQAGTLDLYVGTWKATLENTQGKHTRTLVIRPGDVADTVMTLRADGPTKGGHGYHCVFTAKLESVTFNSVRLGRSTVASAKPPGSCAPGPRSTLTLTSDDQLRRVSEGNKDQLTYDRSSPDSGSPSREGPSSTAP